MKERDKSLSIAKGIGILFVVIGHSGCLYEIKHFIYMFHMPLFFICSGYFFSIPSDRQKFIRFLKRRIVGLWKPYIVFSMVALIIHSAYELYNGSENIFPFFLMKMCRILFTMTGHDIVLLDPFWFFQILFMASMLVAIITYTNYRLKFNLSILSVTIMLFLCLLAYLWSGITVATVWLTLLASIFFCIGKLLSQFDWPKHNNWFFIVSVFVIICYGGTHYFTTMLAVDRHQIVTYIIFGVLGSMMTIGFSKKIVNFNASCWFDYLGQNTLVIFILHKPIFSVLYYVENEICGTPIDFWTTRELYHPCKSVIYTVVGVVLPLLVHKGYKTFTKTN